MNKDRLFPYGIHVVDLMNRINNSQPKGANNKLDSVISNLNYRLQRHGRLAPTKDIARRLDKKNDDQMQLLEEEEGENDIDLAQDDDINTNEVNNMESMFSGCPLLIYLPHIYKSNSICKMTIIRNNYKRAIL